MLMLEPARVYSYADLRAQISDRRLRRLVRDESVLRLRRDAYVSPAMPPDLRRAAVLGGALCCVSALAFRGAWRPPGAGIHVAVPQNASRLTHRGVKGRDLTLHWSMTPVARPLSTPTDAIYRLVRCCSRPVTVAVLDSAMRTGLVTEVAVRDAIATSDRSLGLRFDDLDPTAESGIESLVRLALRDHGLRVEPQVVIAGIGRVDLLVEGRVIVEVDGREWHRGEQERDYRRDLEAIRRGFRVVRVDYAHVIAHSELVVESVMRALSARRDVDAPERLLRSPAGFRTAVAHKY